MQAAPQTVLMVRNLSGSSEPMKFGFPDPQVLGGLRRRHPGVYAVAPLGGPHKVRDGKLVPQKTTRSKRWVEITPRLAPKLRVQKMASPPTAPHDLVFLSRRPTPHDHRNIGGRVLARAVDRAGLQAIEQGGQIVSLAPTFRDLRHTHASALIAQGWDIEEAASRLGHASTAVTQRVYVHELDLARRSDERRARLAPLYSDTPVSVRPV